MKKGAIVITHGCRLNCADTALITSRLERSGFAIRPEDSENFDLAVINTCAVTAEAVRKSRQTLRKLRSSNPHSIIIAAGCAVEVNADLFRQDGADFVLTNPDKKDLESILSGVSAKNHSSNDYMENFNEFSFSRFPFRSRAFVKIQEGCNNFCTYCIVPHVRGRERSRKFTEILDDCKQLLEAGFPELVLTGVNTCAYHDGGKYLGDLLQAISSLPGDFRIRLSSTEPHMNNRGLIDVMASTPKICRFLHLSLQHGSDTILKAMNRHYTSSEYADFVSEAREKIPGLHIGSDVIAGFPGETEKEFQECINFVKKMSFANLHVFTYSPRPGTPAAVMPGRPDKKIASLRSTELRRIGEESKKDFLCSQLGKELPVIFETVSDGIRHGWSDNYIAVHVPEDTAPSGKIINITADRQNLKLK